MAEVLDLEIRVPTSLYHIPLDDYQRYMKVVEGVDTKSEEANDFLNLKALEIFCGLQLKESYKLPMVAFNAVLEQLAKCLSEDTPLVKRFTMRGTDGAQIEFGFNPNLKDMTFGEYVDLDTYLTDWKNAHKAMAVLYRPVIGSKGDMYRIEDYEGSDKYSDLLRYMPTSIVLGAMVFFLSFRNEVGEAFHSFFNGDDAPDGVIKSREAVFAERWNWYQSIYALAGGDVTKFDQVTNQPLYKCLTWLTFENERIKLENQRIKEAYR